MSIKSYQEGGKSLFLVCVSRRSTKDPSIRIQKTIKELRTHTEAIRAEKALIGEVAREVMLREDEGVKFKTLIGEWEKSLRYGADSERPLGSTTIIDYVRSLQIYGEEWANRPLEEITRVDVRQVLERMTIESRSLSRRQTFLSAVNHVFRWAADTGRLKGNIISPAIGFKLKREEENKPEILTLNEIRKLLSDARTCDHDWYYIWACALHSGARSGELMALTWRDVDWENKRLLISKSYNGRSKVTKSTKGGYWREVPINSEFELLLKELRAQAGSRTEVFQSRPSWRNGAAAPILKEFCREIGIPTVKFHTLRACFATQLLRSSVAPAVVMKICGWKDLKTMQRYIRLAGIEIEGATDGYQIIPPREATAKIVELFSTAGQGRGN